QAMAEDVHAQFGRLDVLVNNAGVGLNKPFLTTSLDEWDHQLRVNLTGTFLCGQAAARVMVRQGSGRIINVASISGQRGGQGRAADRAAKAGVYLLAKVLAGGPRASGGPLKPNRPGPGEYGAARGTPRGGAPPRLPRADPRRPLRRARRNCGCGRLPRL